LFYHFYCFSLDWFIQFIIVFFCWMAICLHFVLNHEAEFETQTCFNIWVWIMWVVGRKCHM
jgi:hypothetical protein